MHKFEIMGVAFSILISELVGLIIVIKKFCLTKNYVTKTRMILLNSKKVKA